MRILRKGCLWLVWKHTQVDTGNAVMESDEANNIGGAVTVTVH